MQNAEKPDPAAMRQAQVMTHKYRKAALLASVAAVAGLTCLVAPEAKALESSMLLGETAANPPSTPMSTLASRFGGLTDGTYTGPLVDAYYGQVQVRVSIQGGRLVSIDILRYPADRRTSRYINSQALPMLQREVIRAQSARVSGVSGATLTSRAYILSLDAAFRKAGA